MKVLDLANRKNPHDPHLTVYFAEKDYWLCVCLGSWGLWLLYPWTVRMGWYRALSVNILSRVPNKFGIDEDWYDGPITTVYLGPFGSLCML